MTFTRGAKHTLNKAKAGNGNINDTGDVVPMPNKRSKEQDPIFLPDTHDEVPETDSETDATLSDQDPDFSDNEGEEVNETDEVIETLKRLKSQVAEHSKSIREGITTMHTAMTQQRDFLQVTTYSESISKECRTATCWF